MIFSILLQIIPFKERSDNIFSQNEGLVEVDASGSIGQFYNGSCHMTDPNHMVDSTTRKTDWCSNIAKNKKDMPWLMTTIKDKTMKLTGYGIRSGCCYYGCCCEDDRDTYCCCWIYSWALQGSNDNITWKNLHVVEKDNKFYSCINRVYDITINEFYKYIRLVQLEPWPGCEPCICLNKFELYGTTDDRGSVTIDSDNDDSVSIIGKFHDHNEE